MASRNYAMAYDTPYNERLLSVLEKYDRERDTNGEPDYFHETMEGGAYLGADGKVHSVNTIMPFHPHLQHPLLGAQLPRGLGRVPRDFAGEGVMSGGLRPPGMVSPFVHSVTPNHMVAPGTMAAYPVYNAVEMRALNGGACCGMCANCSGGKFNLGSFLGKAGKVLLPAATTIGTKLATDAALSALAGAGKKPRGRPRKAGGKFNFGKALGSVGKVALPIVEKVGTKVAEKAAEQAVKSYLSGEGVVSAGVGMVKKRGRPRKMTAEGGKFNLLGTLTSVGKAAGKPFEKSVGVNPFTLGYDLGHDVIAPALMGKGTKKGQPRKTARKAYEGAGVGSGGAVDGRKRRAEIVKKVMAEKGLKLVDASKYVKQHGLY